MKEEGIKQAAVFSIEYLLSSLSHDRQDSDRAHARHAKCHTRICLHQVWSAPFLCQRPS